MRRYEPGDRLTVTFTGTVVSRSYDPDGDIRIERDHSKTITYIKPDELEHLKIEVQAPVFEPKAGEIFLLRRKSTLSQLSDDWTTWFAIQRMPTGPIEMVSSAGVFSLAVFKEAYLNRGYEIVKGRVSKV